MALFACAAAAISSVRAPAIPWVAKCCSAAARMRRAVAGFSTFLRPRFISGPSNSHAFHRGFGVTRAGSHAARSDLVNALQVGCGELHFERSEIFIEILAALCARDGNNVLTARKHPGQRELCGRATLLGCHLLNPLDELKILLKVFALKAR